MGALTAALVASSVLTGAGKVQQSRAQARAARSNRDFARTLEQDVMTRGEEEVSAYQRELSQVQGQQRVGLAAQNIDLTQGTAAEIARQTAQIGQQDIATIRRNIEREAWGIRTQANINYRAGMAQSRASTFEALGSFAQAGATFAQSPTGSEMLKSARSNAGTRLSQGSPADVRPNTTLLGSVGSGWNTLMRGRNPLTPRIAGMP